MSIPFDPKEMEVVEEVPGFGGAPPSPIFKYPVTEKEAVNATYRRDAIWQFTIANQRMFCPKVNPDNIARAFVFDGSGMPFGQGGGPDMFGIEWEFIPQVGGSMVRPGKPFLEDANEWFAKVKWPDIDAWEWDEAARYNAEFLHTDKHIICWFMNGWYERLISFMDFESAVVAMIDDEQKDAVKALFDKLSNLYIEIFERYLHYFPGIDAFCIHDDWSAQKDTFFSPATAAEMIVPYMKRVTDYLHSHGKFCDLHSCGNAYKQVPNFIAAGWDSWSGQLVNDTAQIYEEYGDRIIVGVTPELYDPATVSEDEQRARARAYADRFCRPGRPSMFNVYGSQVLTRVYCEELYRQSRLNYAK